MFVLVVAAGAVALLHTVHRAAVERNLAAVELHLKHEAELAELRAELNEIKRGGGPKDTVVDAGGPGALRQLADAVSRSVHAANKELEKEVSALR